MNSIHNNGESDKSLNAGLDKLGRAYGQLDQDKPPELLDQAILNSAHRAVEKQPHWTNLSWVHGLTTAAVFVLAFTLILHQGETVPVPESGIDREEPVRLQSEKTAKTQSLDVKAELPKKLKQEELKHEEMKHKDDSRQDTYQHTSFTTAPQNEAMAGQSRSQAMESRLSGYTQDAAQAKAAPVDQDMEKGEVMFEEALLDETDSIAETPAPMETDRQSAPTAIAAPMAGPGEPGTRARELSSNQAKQKLQEIIKLRQSGDPAWELELESFMKSYPDYRLPEELKVP